MKLKFSLYLLSLKSFHKFRNALECLHKWMYTHSMSYNRGNF